MAPDAEPGTLDEAVEQARADYARRRPLTRAAHEAAAAVMPGGNTRTVLHHGPFPLRLARAEGALLIDVDGQAYVDMLGDYTAGLYGHDEPHIRAAIGSALAGGLSLAGHNTYEPVLAAELVRRFPALELVRFTNSGTEANLMAIALARAATGRPAIAVVDGAYHGGVLSFGHGPSPVNVPYDVVMLRYNDIDASVAALRAAADRLACVVVEPVLGSGGVIPATPEYLRALRDETASLGILLILDEVMTSRLSPQGAGPLAGVRADLMTLGKYLGGGLSFGAFGGRADLMGRFDPASPDALPHAGTFNNNVLSMAAATAGLTQVLTPERIDDVNARGDRLRESLQAVMTPYGWTATGTGSMVGLHPVAGPVLDPGDIAAADDRRRELLFLDLLERGWYVARRGFLALSLAVTDEHVDGFVAAVADSLRQRAGLAG